MQFCLYITRDPEGKSRSTCLRFASGLRWRPRAAMQGLWPWIEQASRRVHRNMLAIALFSRARHERFRDSDIFRRVFEREGVFGNRLARQEQVSAATGSQDQEFRSHRLSICSKCFFSTLMNNCAASTG